MKLQVALVACLVLLLVLWHSVTAVGLSNHDIARLSPGQHLQCGTWKAASLQLHQNILAKRLPPRYLVSIGLEVRACHSVRHRRNKGAGRPSAKHPKSTFSHDHAHGMATSGWCCRLAFGAGEPVLPAYAWSASAPPAPQRGSARFEAACDSQLQWFTAPDVPAEASNALKYTYKGQRGV